MTLHVLNKASVALWRDCCAAIANGDALLLIEDGVFSATQGHVNQHFLQSLQCSPRLYVLAEDLAVRGISARIAADFSSISYRDFVELSLEHAKVVNWQ